MNSDTDGLESLNNERGLNTYLITAGLLILAVLFSVLGGLMFCLHNIVSKDEEQHAHALVPDFKLPLEENEAVDFKAQRDYWKYEDKHSKIITDHNKSKMKVEIPKYQAEIE